MKDGTFTGDRLLALYDRVAEAEDAIPRLRRFVLDLAVRGKLVAQDPTDEPAAELLKRIAKEKARLVKAGGLRARKAAEYAMGEVPFDLPFNWAWAAIGTVFIYDAGDKRDPKELNQNLWLLELEDVEKDTGRLIERIAADQRESQSTKSQFRAGDILYGKLRPYLNKVLVADEPGYSTTEIVALRPYLPLCSGYCALALRCPDFVEYVTRLGQGTKMPRLRTEDAVVAPFPLPPLAEQQRIVAKFDELMALCDRLQAARVGQEAVRDRLTAVTLSRLTAPETDAETFSTHARFALQALPTLTTQEGQIKTLRQTILNLAVRGKLVEQDAAEEPGEDLLERIRHKKNADVGSAEGRRSEKFTASKEDLPFTLPKNWSVAALRELSYNLGDGLHGTPEYINVGDIYFINGTNLRDGRIEVFPNTKKVSENELEIHAKPLNDRTLLVSINGTLTNYAFYRGERVVLGKSACYFEISPLVDMQFIRVLVQSPYYIDYAFEKATGATISNLSLKAMNSLPIPLPPLAEQHRIVARVDALTALCDQLEANLTTATTTRSRLLEALLHEALNGAQGDQAEAAA